MRWNFISRVANGLFSESVPFAPIQHFTLWNEHTWELHSFVFVQPPTAGISFRTWKKDFEMYFNNEGLAIFGVFSQIKCFQFASLSFWQQERLFMLNGQHTSRTRVKSNQLRLYSTTAFLEAAQSALHVEQDHTHTCSLACKSIRVLQFQQTVGRLVCWSAANHICQSERIFTQRQKSCWCKIWAHAVDLILDSLSDKELTLSLITSHRCMCPC